MPAHGVFHALGVTFCGDVPHVNCVISSFAVGPVLVLFVFMVPFALGWFDVDGEAEAVARQRALRGVDDTDDDALLSASDSSVSDPEVMSAAARDVARGASGLSGRSRRWVVLTAALLCGVSVLQTAGLSFGWVVNESLHMGSTTAGTLAAFTWATVAWMAAKRNRFPDFMKVCCLCLSTAVVDRRKLCCCTDSRLPRLY
jgi:hypothetical protein